ncbi:MAG: cupin domain-containing protein [Saprospiraceae bacterium]|nr:cupin domain-containing protein [Saprospiraceae bacterium]
MNRKNFLKALGGVALSSTAINSLANSPKNESKMESTPKVVHKNEGKHLMVFGNLQIHKLDAADTNGRFTLIEGEGTPGFGVPPHVHEFEDEIFWILEGEMEFTVGEITSTLKAGDTIFLPRNIPHSFNVIGTKKSKCLMMITPAGLEGLFDIYSQQPEGPPDFEKLIEISAEYGIHFV